MTVEDLKWIAEIAYWLGWALGFSLGIWVGRRLTVPNKTEEA